MLVLSRKVGEEIRIGDKIRVKVLRNDRGVVRLGVHAPEDVPIRREEVQERIDAKKALANGQAPPAAR